MSLQIGFVVFCTLQNLSTTIVVLVLFTSRAGVWSFMAPTFLGAIVEDGMFWVKQTRFLNNRKVKHLKFLGE